MKKIIFCLMALALCATVFTSCHKDDDDDNDMPMAQITATGDFNFEATAFSKATSGSETSDVTGTDKKLTDIFKSNKDRITIYGLNKQKQFISITVNATKGQTGSFHEGLNATELLINYLQGGSITDALKNSIDALVIFKESQEANESSAGFWFSTSADVNITGNMQFGSVTFITGQYTATLMNSAKQQKTISGTFICPGI